MINEVGSSITFLKDHKKSEKSAEKHLFSAAPGGQESTLSPLLLDRGVGNEAHFPGAGPLLDGVRFNLPDLYWHAAPSTGQILQLILAGTQNLCLYIHWH